MRVRDRVRVIRVRIRVRILPCASFVFSSKRLACACTRAFNSNTIYGGGKEGQYKAVNGQGVAGVGKRGRGKVAKGGSKMSKVIHSEGRRQARRGFGGGVLNTGMGEMIGGWDL